MKKELEQSLREYYTSTFPNDELGTEIYPDVTFDGLNKALNERKDVYDYTGAYDSIIRERLFQRLAKILCVDYDYVYNKWAMRYKL